MVTDPAPETRAPVPGAVTGAALEGDVVRVELAALPAHVRTARLICGAVARRAGLEDSYVDELKLAVGEACTRAVELHAGEVPHLPVEVRLGWTRGLLTVEVSDRAGAEPVPEHSPFDLDQLEQLAGPDGGSAGLGLALVKGLVDDVTVAPREGGGTTITMRWPLSD